MLTVQLLRCLTAQIVSVDDTVTSSQKALDGTLTSALRRPESKHFNVPLKVPACRKCIISIISKCKKQKQKQKLLNFTVTHKQRGTLQLESPQFFECDFSIIQDILHT